jgi:Flp pilus assembly protein TadG
MNWKNHPFSKRLAARRPLRCNKSQAGGATIELAISLVILLTMTFGVIEVGHGFYAYSSVANAARDGARFAIVRGSACTSWATACPASATDVQNFIQSNTPPGIDPSRLTVTTTWIPNNKPGSAVKVAVQYRFRFTMAFITVSDATITSSSQMVIWE